MDFIEKMIGTGLDRCPFIIDIPGRRSCQGNFTFEPLE